MKIGTILAPLTIAVESSATSFRLWSRDSHRELIPDWSRRSSNDTAWGCGGAESTYSGWSSFQLPSHSNLGCPRLPVALLVIVDGTRIAPLW